MNKREILDLLNQYDGVNTWADVIYKMEDYDRKLTAKINRYYGPVCAMRNGDVYLYSRGMGYWMCGGNYFEDIDPEDWKREWIKIPKHHA